MKKISFCHNWNQKLNCFLFSTIRKHKGGEDYYGPKEGKVFAVSLNNRILGNARLAYCKLAPFHEIPLAILLLDTGSTTKDKALAIFKRFYGDFDESDLFYTLVFCKVGTWNGK